MILSIYIWIAFLVLRERIYICHRFISSIRISSIVFSTLSTKIFSNQEYYCNERRLWQYFYRHCLDCCSDLYFFQSCNDPWPAREGVTIIKGGYRLDSVKKNLCTHMPKQPKTRTCTFFRMLTRVCLIQACQGVNILLKHYGNLSQRLETLL